MSDEIPTKPLSRIADTAADSLPPAAEMAHNTYHRQCAGAAREAALWAALCGLELMRVKKFLIHGEWLTWIAANCTFSRRTAVNYLKAGARAAARLGDYAKIPSELSEEEFNHFIALVLALLTDEEREEERRQLITAVRPAKIKRARPNLKPLHERALFTPQAVPLMAQRWHHTPEEARRAFIQAIPRGEVLTYLAR